MCTKYDVFNRPITLNVFYGEEKKDPRKESWHAQTYTKSEEVANEYNPAASQERVLTVLAVSCMKTVAALTAERTQ